MGTFPTHCGLLPWALPPALTQEGRLGVGPRVSSSGAGPPARPLPGLRGEEGLPEDQQKAAQQRLFHLQGEEEGRGCDKHKRRGQGEMPGRPGTLVSADCSPSSHVSHVPLVLKIPFACGP